MAVIYLLASKKLNIKIMIFDKDENITITRENYFELVQKRCNPPIQSLNMTT
jgi:hypothetical protein